ncbi:ATP-binding cassette domain-containing protein [Sinomicrobium soli]|uniref:ATP-binding cassette domain-containing protein n=1 Tax=Sinomicrobium sp. N-1-3-6 TaxID=2219864 RepID=UPI000DCEEA59|nr:ATP-binding cassette domain-containing protein [Sinomicrobium sp. N-1-3-6]RAV30124.1 molybdenum ABC transporter ATP-binding protein [Sinomicrobium sp. N-1-3-6]
MIYCDRVSLTRRGFSVLDGISFRLPEGASLAVVGESGSGKTTLCRILAGKVQPSSGKFGPATSRVEMVEQQDQFLAVSGRGHTHYSQRYEARDTSGMPGVYDYLKRIARESGVSGEVLDKAIDSTRIGHILERKLLQLSNGERKRTQLAAALLKTPDVLILDQPFVGLDAVSREHLDTLLEELSGTVVLIIICGAGQVPADMDKVLELDKGRVKQYTDRESYTVPAEKQITLKDSTWFERLRPSGTGQHDIVVGMEDVDVYLGGQHILKKITWQVRSGERWALVGHNGAGKTTLLSLITADNPQGYNNKLTLFDRRRGTGESIWDIKRKIGFVSAELHLYFLRGKGILNTVPGIDNGNREVYSSLSCLDVIVSGFRDEVGVVSTPSEYQSGLARQWMHVLGLERLQQSNFAHASLGEQRCILLARALVKCPSLLILDEPLQGLDEQQVAYFRALLNRLCETLGTTMIFVSHYTDEIPECVDRKLVLDRGEVIECGRIE